MKYDITSHLLPLKGTLNARDLGNYPVAGQRKTRNNVFFRSDSTSKYQKEDITYLTAKNLGLIIDLRSESEVANAPSVFFGMKNMRYENIQMLDDIHSGLTIDSLPPSLSSIYMHLLDHSKSDFLKVFNVFAETIENNQSCLFHCAVGKDRTGTTAMLLLDLAGASEEVIIQDYAASYNFMKPLFDNQMDEYRARGYNVPEYLFRSDAANMEKTLSYFRNVYGNAKDYLLKCGVSQNYIDVIINRFVI